MMIFKGLISILLAIILSSCGANITDEALFSASILEGNHVHFGPLGVAIQVEKPIQITSVGAFEGNSEEEINVKVAIFDNSNKQLVPSSEIYEINKQNSTVEKNYRFRKIKPISISPGSYMLVAQGYNGKQKFGNSGISGKGPAANKNELVSIGSCFFGNGGISCPDTKDYHIYHAGNIKFRPFAESVEARLSRLEAENKKLKEANAEILNKLNEKPDPNTRRRPPVSPAEVQQQEPAGKIVYFGYEDDFCWKYALTMKSDPTNKIYNVSWHLRNVDKEWRSFVPFTLVESNNNVLSFSRGEPPEWIYEAEVDDKGNLVNGKRYTLKNGKKDKIDATWGLLLVK